MLAIRAHAPLSLLQLLLDEGANICKCSKKGNNAVQIAISGGQEDVAYLLLERLHNQNRLQKFLTTSQGCIILRMIQKEGMQELIFLLQKCAPDLLFESRKDIEELEFLSAMVALSTKNGDFHSTSKNSNLPGKVLVPSKWYRYSYNNRFSRRYSLRSCTARKFLSAKKMKNTVTQKLRPYKLHHLQQLTAAALQDHQQTFIGQSLISISMQQALLTLDFWRVAFLKDAFLKTDWNWACSEASMGNSALHLAILGYYILQGLVTTDSLEFLLARALGVLRQLITMHVDINKCGMLGLTALDLATALSVPEDICKVLEKNGAILGSAAFQNPKQDIKHTKYKYSRAIDYEYFPKLLKQSGYCYLYQCDSSTARDLVANIMNQYFCILQNSGTFKQDASLLQLAVIGCKEEWAHDRLVQQFDKHACNIVDIKSRTPLHYSLLFHDSNKCDQEKRQRFKKLLTLFVPEAVDKQGRTCLHFAVMSGSVESVQLLLHYYPGTRRQLSKLVNLQDKLGWSSIHLAAVLGQVEMVKILLEHGADCLQLGPERLSLFDLCLMSLVQEIIKQTRCSFSEIGNKDVIGRKLDILKLIASKVFQSDLRQPRESLQAGAWQQDYELPDSYVEESDYGVEIQNLLPDRQQISQQSALNISGVSVEPSYLDFSSQNMQSQLRITNTLSQEIIFCFFELRANKTAYFSNQMGVIKAGSCLDVTIGILKGQEKLGSNFRCELWVAHDPGDLEERMHKLSYKAYDVWQELVKKQAHAVVWITGSYYQKYICNQNLQDCPNQCELFQHAVARGDSQAVDKALSQLQDKEFLLKQFVNHQDSRWDNRFPLYLAVVNGHFKIAEILMEAGAEVNLVGGYNQDDSLFMAVFNNRYDFAKLLLENRALPDSARKTDQQTCICKAAELGNTAMVDLLVEWGESIDARTGWGITPLISASNKNHVQMVEHLLECGANVKKSSRGKTPLYYACIAGNVEVVKVLLQRGASPWPRHLRQPVESRKSALRAGPNVEAKAAGLTMCDGPCIAAAHAGSVEVLEALTASVKNSDVHKLIGAVNSEGLSPLMVSCQEGHLTFVRKLVSILQDSPAVDLVQNELFRKNKQGQTAASIANQQGHHACADFLVRLLKAGNAELTEKGAGPTDRDLVSVKGKELVFWGKGSGKESNSCGDTSLFSGVRSLLFAEAGANRVAQGTSQGYSTQDAEGVWLYQARDDKGIREDGSDSTMDA